MIAGIPCATKQKTSCLHSALSVTIGSVPANEFTHLTEVLLPKEVSHAPVCSGARVKTTGSCFTNQETRLPQMFLLYLHNSRAAALSFPLTLHLCATHTAFPSSEMLPMLLSDEVFQIVKKDYHQTYGKIIDFNNYGGALWAASCKYKTPFYNNPYTYELDQLQAIRLELLRFMGSSKLRSQCKAWRRKILKQQRKKQLQLLSKWRKSYKAPQKLTDKYMDEVKSIERAKDVL